MLSILKFAQKGLTLPDERGRTMGFPMRQDYVSQLQEHGLVSDEAAFIADDRLTEAVYLDWLLRPQVGCVFAQLLARPVYRTGIRTVVARGSSGLGDPSEIAIQITRLVNESVEDTSTEALSVLLPQILDLESLTRLVWELGMQPGWAIEQERLLAWDTRTHRAQGRDCAQRGCRNAWHGTVQHLPTTRQCLSQRWRSEPRLGGLREAIDRKHTARLTSLTSPQTTC